jgi:hypothetical protein
MSARRRYLSGTKTASDRSLAVDPMRTHRRRASEVGEAIWGTIDARAVPPFTPPLAPSSPLRVHYAVRSGMPIKPNPLPPAAILPARRTQASSWFCV